MSTMTERSTALHAELTKLGCRLIGELTSRPTTDKGPETYQVWSNKPKSVRAFKEVNSTGSTQFTWPDGSVAATGFVLNQQPDTVIIIAKLVPNPDDPEEKLLELCRRSLGVDTSRPKVTPLTVFGRGRNGSEEPGHERNGVFESRHFV